MGMAKVGAKFGTCSWDERKSAVLRREWGRVSRRDLAQRLGCHIHTVIKYAEELGLLVPKARHAKQA